MAALFIYVFYFILFFEAVLTSGSVVFSLRAAALHQCSPSFSPLHQRVIQPDGAEVMSADRWKLTFSFSGPDSHTPFVLSMFTFCFIIRARTPKHARPHAQCSRGVVFYHHKWLCWKHKVLKICFPPPPFHLCLNVHNLK